MENKTLSFKISYQIIEGFVLQNTARANFLYSNRHKGTPKAYLSGNHQSFHLHHLVQNLWAPSMIIILGELILKIRISDAPFRQWGFFHGLIDLRVLRTLLKLLLLSFDVLILRVFFKSEKITLSTPFSNFLNNCFTIQTPSLRWSKQIPYHWTSSGHWLWASSKTTLTRITLFTLVI